MAIVRHTTQYSDAYLDISYYVPPHQYTPADIEMYLISPRPQFPPHEPAVPVREFLIVSDLNDWFEDILDEAEEEIEIEAIADPIARRDIVTAFFNATNIDYPKKKQKMRSILKEGNSPLKKTVNRNEEARIKRKMGSRDAYLDISYYVSPHQNTPAEIEKIEDTVAVLQALQAKVSSTTTNHPE